MTPNLPQKDWLTIDEAAAELSAALSETVSAQQVLRFAIDGHLPLCLYLPAEVKATCERHDDDSIDWERQEFIQGLWDLPMAGRGKLQIEHLYHSMSGVHVPLGRPGGAYVENDELLCQLPPDLGESGMSPRAASDFPRGTVVAVRRTVLEKLIAQHSSATKRRRPDFLDKLLGERERATHLTIIAALAKALDIDISKPSKAAAAIESLTTSLGARVSARTVEEHLKRIPDALERKGKTAP